MDKAEIVDTLNDLIRITEDSHEGYRRSAEDAEDPGLSSLFNDLAAQRGAIVRDLQRLVAEQGGAPEASGTLMGSAHRFFVDLKAAVVGRDRATILREVERGETEAVRRYELASEKDLPPHVLEAVRGHLARIRTDRNRMEILKEAGAEG